ncbi:MAG TPA: hypothetical protein VJ834_02845 [Burkholderiales bacterium]|nr:hypothetical protein [Burkholderiales bacterium]
MNEQPRGPDAADDLYDPQLACRYREAAREAPPQILDDVILAAARRDARSRALDPQPGGTAVADIDHGHCPRIPLRAWRLPLALAAVVVVSVSIVAVSPDVHDSEPREEQVLPQTLADAQGTPTTPPQTAVVPELPKSVPEQAVEPPRSAPARERSVQEPASQYDDAPQARAAAKAPAEAQHRDQAGYNQGLEARGPGASSVRAEADSATPPGVLARQYAAEPPEKWGEKILELRREGRAAEADALLAEFRQRFPDHAVPPEWTR